MIDACSIDFLCGKLKTRLDFDAQIIDVCKRLCENSSTFQGIFFFYAGHGIQFDGASYLVPTDVDLSRYVVEMACQSTTFDSEHRVGR